MKAEAQSRTVTVEQAAKELGIGRSLAYELCRTGQLPALRLGHRFVVPRERLERLLEEGMPNEDGAGQEVNPKTGADT